MAYVQGLTEVLVTLVLLYYVTSMRSNNTAERKRDFLERDDVNAAHYTVWVEGLPPDTTRQHVLEFFDRLANLHAVDWTYGACCIWCGRKAQSQARPQLQPETEETLHRFSQRHGDSEFRLVAELPARETANPVRNTTYAGEQIFVGKWVADVNVAHPAGNMLMAGLATTTLNQEVRLAVERARIAKHRQDEHLELHERHNILRLAERLHDKQ